MGKKFGGGCEQRFGNGWEMFGKRMGNVWETVGKR